MQHYPLVTIVGGSGFVGRYAVKAFAQAGYRIRVLVRNTVGAEFLKTAATVGQIAIEHVDITRPETLAGKFAGSDVVVSLVSILYESGSQKFDAINVAGARAVAEAARAAGAKSLVHVSALGVERSAADTRYGATKLAGEEAVRAAFPSAVILRPSLIVGAEDGFFQRFGRMTMISPALPLIAGGKTLFQPVLVTDVAQAILAAMGAEHAGKTYAVAGNERYSFREMLEMMARITNRRPWLVTIPAGVAKLKGFFCELMPFAPLITRDQVALLRHDNVVTDGEKTLAELGIAPASVAAALPALLARYIKN